ncbi:MAG: hypothetical protein GX030_02905 [Firmicutes bacterium]|nr:hypothetical protein [Bacillota bacterium]
MKKSLVMVLMLLLALGTTATAATRDTAKVKLAVDVPGHVEIAGLTSDSVLSVSMKEPGDQSTTRMASLRFEVLTNTRVKFGFANDDKFPRLTLRDEEGNVLAGFKDPGNPEWSNPLKSDIQIRGGEVSGTYKYVDAGRHYEWLDFRVHWDSRDELPWWKVLKGEYEGEITLIVQEVD